MIKLDGRGIQVTLSLAVLRKCVEPKRQSISVPIETMKAMRALLRCLIKVFAGFVIFSAASPSLTWAASEDDGVGDERPVVQWYSFSFPPAYIMNGPFKGRGYQDLMLDYFEERLTGFRLQRRATVLARVIANVRHGSAACAGALGRTRERESFMVFSDPILTSLPIRLVVDGARGNKLKDFADKNGRIGLSQLSAMKELSGVAVKDRSYGPLIDPWVREQKSGGNLHLAARSELAFLMLARGRVDYTFAYPDEVGYFRRLHEGKDMMDTLVTLPLKEEAVLVQSHIGCSADPVGQRVIEAVNHIIRENTGGVPAWQLPYREWIDGAALDE